MRTLLSLASLALLSLAIDAAAVAAVSRVAEPAVSPAVDTEWIAAVCQGDGLPFALPSAAATEDWTDSEHEAWADGAWGAYCARASTVEAYAVCACTGH